MGNSIFRDKLSVALFDTPADYAVVLDGSGSVRRVNPAAARLLGLRQADIDAKPRSWEQHVSPDERAAVRQLMHALKTKHVPPQATYHLVTPTNERHLVEWKNVVIDDGDQPDMLLLLGNEVNGQTRLTRTALRLAAYSAFRAQVNRAIAHADNDDDLAQQFCGLAVEYASVQLAWIGIPGEDLHVRYLGKAGPSLGYLDDVDISVDARCPGGRGPAGLVWREGQAVFNTPFDRNGILGHCHDQATAHGLKSTTALPIRQGDRVWGILSLYGDTEDFFDETLQSLLLELAEDISRGLSLIKIRQYSKALLDHSYAGVQVIRDRHIVYSNARMAEIFGYPDRNQLVGRSTAVLYTDDETYQYVGASYATLEATGTTRLQAVPCVKKTGEVFPCDLVGIKLDNVLSIWTFIDVTTWERQRKDLIRLQRLNHALMAASEVFLDAESKTSLLDAFCDRLIQGTGFRATWIGRPTDDGTFQILARAGDGAALLDDVSLSIHQPRCVAARAWRQDQAVLDNEELAAFEADSWLEPFRTHKWASRLATPIRRAGEPWGILEFVSEHADAFNEQMIEACERIGAFIGWGLEELDRKQRLVELEAKAQHLARHDALTGIPNRFALDQHLPDAIARADRNGASLVVGIIDVDDFKPVNDSHGHGAGDVLLCQLATRLGGLIRKTDYLARLGGDEFVIVFENLKRVDLHERLGSLLLRLHKAVEKPFDLGEGREASVGLSMGLAMYPQDAKEPDALLRLADMAMYQSKSNKPHRTRWWQLDERGHGFLETSCREVNDG